MDLIGRFYFIQRTLGFKQVTDRTIFAFQKDHSSFNVENGLVEGKRTKKGKLVR